MCDKRLNPLQWWFRYHYSKSRIFAPWADPEQARIYCYRRAREIVVNQEKTLMSTTPKELDLISDVVLNYKPKEKAKASKRREKKRAKRDTKKG